MCAQKTVPLEACLHVTVTQGVPVSFYSRRMGIIYTYSQGHSPHIYYMTLTAATGSQDAPLPLQLSSSSSEENLCGFFTFKGKLWFYKHFDVFYVVLTIIPVCNNNITVW